MRHVLRDSRMWFAIGLVVRDEDGADPVEVNGTDVLVEVVLQPSLTPVTCRLPARVWAPPDEGDEVMVGLPEGALDFMPVIVGVLSSGHVPAVQGPQAGRIVLERNEVFVHDGNGGAVSLALKQDVINVDDKYASHKHIDGTGLLTSGPGLVGIPNPGTPPPVFIGITPLIAAVITGTSVLKAK